jgi:hypothetical protein
MLRRLGFKQALGTIDLAQRADFTLQPVLEKSVFAGRQLRRLSEEGFPADPYCRSLHGQGIEQLVSAREPLIRLQVGMARARHERSDRDAVQRTHARQGHR